MITTTRNLLKSVIGITLVAASLAAQQPTAPIFSQKTLEELQRIQAAALKSDRAYEWTAFLTNNIGPRFSGTPQAARAEQYVADEMRKLGLAVEMQKLKVPHWVRGEERAELVSWQGMAAGTVQKLVIKTLGGSIATPPEGIEAEVVVVQNFAELERMGRERIAGKVVVFNYRFDRRLSDAGFGLEAYGQAVQYRSSGAIAAARYGAVASLVRSAGGSQNRLAHTGGMRYDPAVTKIPGAALSHEDADLIAHLAKQGPVRIRLKLGAETLPDADGHNVIADLRGSERPDEIVIVSGHLDSWDVGTGALDDAGGVAVSMQVPYILKQLGLQPKRTIRVIAYANEENGLVGGREYAVRESSRIEKHFAAIESDLGVSHPVGILYAGRPEVGAAIEPILQILRSQGSGLTRRENGVGADIGPLTQRGVPSFAPWFNTRKYFDYHHTEADTFDKIDPDEMKKLAALMAVLAYALANAEGPLPR